MRPIIGACAVCMFFTVLAGALRAQASADVVVIVDTSTSIAQPGMDPERTSLLVTKLFSDIVPGRLSVIRSLDLKKDEQWLPARDTGKTVPCSEDPSKTCRHVEPLRDWYQDARANRYGAKERPARGDAGFKRDLEQHLAQVINNSLFGLGFRGAQGVFDSHGSSVVPRLVIWLSDGTADDEPQMDTAIRELQAAGVAVEAVVFGRGSTATATRLGLNPRQVRNAGEMMKAFAEMFRRAVEAPYKLDNLIATDPSFEMKPKVDEAWIVVYGNDTLGEVEFHSPDGRKRADYAQDKREGSGAYKVLYVTSPAAGRWTVHADGGGSGAAYAVVQRSALSPVLLEPRTAIAGVPVTVVGGLAAPGGQVLTPADLPEPVALTLTANGRSYELLDEGADGDRTPHDGRYSAIVIFDAPGEVELLLRAHSQNMIDKTIKVKMPVAGVFHYRGGPVTLDLGSMKAGAQSCQEMRLNAAPQGAIPFQLNVVRTLPAGHSLLAQVPRGAIKPGGQPVEIGPGQVVGVCLETQRRAVASEANGEQWLELVAAGSASPDGRVSICLRWRVKALSFWELWGWLIIGILILLAFLLWIYGYIKPKRFQRHLAVVFVPERSEIEEQTPQPITQWRGVGIGWYKDARAYLHSNFRVSNQARGALASLHAISGGTRVEPGSGDALYRETIDFEWEPVSQAGRRASSSDVFRVGDHGPFLKVTVRRG